MNFNCAVHGGVIKAGPASVALQGPCVRVGGNETLFPG